MGLSIRHSPILRANGWRLMQRWRLTRGQVACSLLWRLRLSVLGLLRSRLGLSVAPINFLRRMFLRKMTLVRFLNLELIRSCILQPEYRRLRLRQLITKLGVCSLQGRVMLQVLLILRASMYTIHCTHNTISIRIGHVASHVLLILEHSLVLGLVLELAFNI